MVNLLTSKYILLQGAYWMICCSVSGYSTVFLVSRGFSAGKVGLLVAWANVLAAILQPMTASLADHSKRITLRELILIISLAGFLPALVLALTPCPTGASVFLYPAILAAMSLLQPLVNALGMRFAGQGLNFGLARGLGSLCYAVFSTLLGFLAQQVGEWCIPFFSAVLFLGVLLSSRHFHPGPGAGASGNRNSSRAGLGAFLRRYRAFLGVLAGTAFIFAFHSIVNTYLFQISVAFGGDSSSMGVALSIGAVCELPAMLGFSWIVRRFPIRTLLRVSALFFILKAAAFLISSSMTGIFFSMTLQCLSFALFIPASVYYADNETEAEDRVLGQALMTAASTVGGVIGNLSGGWICDFAGIRALLTLGLALAAAGAILIFLFTSPIQLLSKPAGA